MKVFPFPWLVLLAAGSVPGEPPGEGEHGFVRGITISCQTWGWEWGQDAFGDELDELVTLGVNWVAIHPYAAIRADGSVGSRRGALDPDAPPDWLVKPIAFARSRGMAILIKPHLAHWGSPFGWRGEIRFEDPAARERFWREYGAWIEALARVTRDADAFCVGTELGGMLADPLPWRALIERVRRVSPARLTYAANWDDFERVTFWDALDAVGVQAYFPLSEHEDPGAAELRAGWARALAPLRALSRRTGKPVVFTELGYPTSPDAAREPWSDERALLEPSELQERCLRVALAVLAEEAEWLRGAFLWKWFVGEPRGRGDRTFPLDTPRVRAVIASGWASDLAAESAGER